MMSHIQHRIAALLVLLAIPFIGQTELAQQLVTTPAELRELPREFRLDGVVEAVSRATVSAQTQGQVVEIFFDVDDFVEKDAVLLRLDDTEQRAQLARAQADLMAAKARLEEARDEYNRIKNIFKKKLVSQSAMDKAAAALKTAKAQHEAAQAGLKQARQQLDYTVVRAPYSGIVIERHAEVGEVARPGQPLMTGISLDKLRVLVDVPQSLIPAIRKHKKARVLLPSGGFVESTKLTIFPFADHTSNTFKVRLDLPEGQKDLFPGMFVKTLFTTGKKEELLVPAAAVVYRSELTAVYVVDEQGRIHFRHLRVGREAGNGYLIVLAGLQPGDRIALDPIAAGVALKAQSRKAENKDD